MKRYKVIVPIKGELSCYIDGPDNAKPEEINRIIRELALLDFTYNIEEDNKDIEYYPIHKVEENV